jgi:ribosomal protein L16 Arg81 hydroxylase
MDKITLEQILEPVGVKNFFKNYWNKKHLIIRRNKFKDLFTWDDFTNCLNKYPYIKGLQIIDYTDKGDGRWCLDKVRNKKLNEPLLSKKEIYNQWKQLNKTFVIPFAEYEKEKLTDICFEFEKYFGSGQANIYASPKENSKSFPAHADQTENFLFHTEGKTKWTIYKEFIPNKPNKILDQFILEPGDLLYIPQYQYHKVDTIGPRILISIHFKNKKNQALDNFKITTIENNPRDKWYNWKPYKEIKIKKILQHPRMQSRSWKKPYFNNLK